ncbi:MAG: hypothetical protein Q7J69_00520 [Candidatus Omnitrophota bacterium]|nr:hypothetical protein [Candidatus Omnitrophota bacterium]
MKPLLKHRVPGTLYPVLLFSLLLPFASVARADVIYDTSGGTLKGLVVEEHADRVVLNTEEGERTLFRSQIEEIFYAEPERNYLTLGGQALEGGDFEGARGFFRKGLQINPDFSEAADALERVDDLEKKRELLTGGLDFLKALKKQWGITLEEEKDLTVIREVLPGSLSERAGLDAGDGLIAAWSSSLAFLPSGAVAKELVGPPGSKIKLTLRRTVNLPAPAALEMKLSMERLGLTVAGSGDRIVSIGGKSTRYLPLEQARKMIQAARDKGVELVIHRDLRVTRE